MKRIGSSITGVLLVGALAVPAMAAHDTNPSDKVESYTYDLNEVADNADGEVDGTVRLAALPNGKIQVKVEASGLAPNLPHAQHIHAPVSDEGDLVRGECPTIAADGALDRPVDGLIDTVEGVPTYGLVRQSLTTSEGTSPDDALALGRFPVADAEGNLEYERTFTPTDERVWSQLGDVEVVVHGIDFNGDEAYDFDAGPSSLNPEAPLEATIPVLCGGPPTA